MTVETMKIAQADRFIFTNNNDDNFMLTSQTDLSLMSQTDRSISTADDTADFLLTNQTYKSMTMNGDLDNS